MNSKKNNHILSTMLKIIVAHECYQSLTDDDTELIYYHNNDYKTKFDYLKKLSMSDI